MWRPLDARAWGTKEAHWRLADDALVRADAERAIAEFLQQELDLPEGRKSKLILSLGFDPGGLDGEIGPVGDSRLNRHRNLATELRGPAPDKVRIEFSEPQSVDRLIRAGVWAEDNPNARARHHFHDPTFERSPPVGNHGLDDQKPIPGLNQVAEFGTFVFRGGDFRRYLASVGCNRYLGGLCDVLVAEPDIGNFEFRGRSALDRALNRSLGGLSSSSLSPQNHFSFPDVERYLYRGLTAPTEAERSHYLALHFVAFGHVLHLLQDQSSPGHVRNDFVSEHALRVLASFEAVGDKYDPTDSVFQRIDAESEALFTSRPLEFLRALASDDPRYFPDLTRMRSSDAGLELADYWDQGDPSSATGRGLAEVVQREVFSTGSLRGAPGAGSEYPLPHLPSSCSPTATAGAGDSLVFSMELWERDLATGEAIPEINRYVSSRQIPHLGRCRFHAEQLGNAGIGTTFPVTLVDESVQRDYLETLWPIAIDHTAQMMATYYQKRIHVIPEFVSSFRLANPTRLPFVVDLDTVEIAYEGVDGERHVTSVECFFSGIGATDTLAPAEYEGGLGPESEFFCDLPTSLPVAAQNPDDYWVVVRGQHGVRGSPEVDPAEWEDGDFVVGFEHQQSRLVIMDAVPNPSGNPATSYRLGQTPVDPINGLSGPSQAALAPSTPLRDLSTEIAAGLVDLGSVAAPQIPALTLLDVRADPTRNRIAFVRAVSSKDTEIIVADLDLDLTSAAAYRRAPLASSRHYLVDGGPPDGRRGSFSLVWNKDPSRSEVMFASRPDADPAPGDPVEEDFHVYSPDTGSFASTNSFARPPAFYFLSSAFGNQLVGTESNSDLYLARQSDLSREARITAPRPTGEVGRVRACVDDDCPPGLDDVSLDEAGDWSTDGALIALTAFPFVDPGSQPVPAFIAIADLSTNTVVPLRQLGGGLIDGFSPAFSPDDRYLAYLGPGRDVFVVEVEAALFGTAVPLQVTKSDPSVAQTRERVVWPGSGLRLPGP